MAEIDLTPTEEMAANAARGLELRRKHGKGGTEIGVARARDISNRKNLSPETVRRMHAFFSRHEKNKAGGEDDAGYIAWMLWSGDAGRDWAKRKVEQMDKGENQRSDTYKEIAQRLGSAATNDRPGAKAKFDVASRVAELRGKMTRYLARSGSWDGIERAQPGLSSLVGDIISGKVKPTDAMLDIVFRQLNTKVGGGFSRPGAKAEMARDLKVRKGNFTDAVAIVGQNGGGSASFYAGLILRHKDGEEQVLWMKHGYSTEKAAERAALQRFDAHVSRMSRPGAKAKFGTNKRIIRRAGHEFLCEDEGNRTRISIKVDGAWEHATTVNTDNQTATEWIEANAKPSHPSRWLPSAHARPGAKAKFGDVGSDDNKIRYLLGEAESAIQHNAGMSIAAGFVKKAESLMQDKTPSDLRSRIQRVKAMMKDANAVREGEKVSAADDAVSRKIRKLMDEGKPQKQAVAIALDLERRGEL